MAHHTKDKGDIGVAKAHADLTSQDFLVLFPMTEHAPFDLVAYKSGEFFRVQVKYRAARRGVMVVEFSSTWADKHGTHKRPTDKSQIDIVCIYCPETDECYYVRPGDYATSVTLRIVPSRNNQSFGVLFADKYRSMPAASSREPAPERLAAGLRRSVAEGQLALWQTSA